MAAVEGSKFSTYGEVFGGPDQNELYQEDDLKANIRCATPAIVQEYNSVERTIKAQPTIMEIVQDDFGKSVYHPLPLLLDVPVMFPSAGGFQITFPINVGDECLVHFSDRCIDAWWQNGGIQSQAEIRMHDLSDGFAVFGPKSLVNVPLTDTVNMRIDGPTQVIIKGVSIVPFKDRVNELIAAFNSHTHNVLDDEGNVIFRTTSPNNTVAPYEVVPL